MSDERIEPTALDAAEKWGRERYPPDLRVQGWWSGDTKSLARLLLSFAGERVAEESERCKRDVCMYCGGRAIGYGPHEGMNDAGNYVHRPIGGGAPVLCRATPIISRGNFAAALRAGEGGDRG